MASVAGADPGRNQEPGTASGSLTRVSRGPGTRTFIHRLPKNISRKWMESRVKGMPVSQMEA